MDTKVLEKLDWPQQPRSYLKTQEIWASALQATICHQNRKLNQPLGKWYKSADIRRYQWDDNNNTCY
eukprot:14251691-Ditylum_brightwellii.AAC.1